MPALILGFIQAHLIWNYIFYPRSHPRWRRTQVPKLYPEFRSRLYPKCHRFPSQYYQFTSQLLLCIHLIVPQPCFTVFQFSSQKLITSSVRNPWSLSKSFPIFQWEQRSYWFSRNIQFPLELFSPWVNCPRGENNKFQRFF